MELAADVWHERRVEPGSSPASRPPSAARAPDIVGLPVRSRGFGRGVHRGGDAGGPLAGLGLAPLAVLVAYLGMRIRVHWPTDVVAGVLLGVAMAVLGNRIVDSVAGPRRRPECALGGGRQYASLMKWPRNHTATER